MSEFKMLAFFGTVWNRIKKIATQICDLILATVENTHWQEARLIMS